MPVSGPADGRTDTAEPGPDRTDSEPAGGTDPAGSGGGAAIPAALDSLFVAQLQSGRLTPAQRRIARYICDHGPSVAFLSSGELAARAGVSQASVIRFATAVGYSGYGAMIEAIREIVLAPRPARAVGGADPALNRMQLAVEHSIDSLRYLRDHLADLAPLQEAARLLADSAPMPVCGFRGSVPMASWFSFFASKIHPNVMALWGSDSHMLEKVTQARLAGASALFAIVMPRYPTQALLTLEAARRSGLKVVLLADSTLTPLASYADVLLPAPVNPHFVFDSQIAPVQMAAALLELLADVHPERTQQRLDALEELAADHDFFLPED
ncbi:MurR/RpiR family transcriptional regulator [Streptomyces sp. NPDC008139]|uniref:MurR/RpiR family transcriptional regulator n=1 Tax=Streptomyces sp. NPDC008139 TaxID=3364814 RepID=UPI0036EFAF1A